MSKKSTKKNRTLDIIILMMQMISLIANLWLLKHAIDRSIVKKKTAWDCRGAVILSWKWP